MKFFILVICIVMSVGSFANDEGEGPVLVDSKFNKSYVPIGFDSNDQVQFVVEGVFPNGCYKTSLVEVDVDHATKTIKLSGKSYKYQGACIQVTVEYSNVVDVGVLEPGTYSIVQGKDEEVLGSLPVVPNTVEGADDFLYAPISQAMLTRVGKDVLLVLTGTLTNSCLSLSEIKIIPQKDVVVVQPIVKVSNLGDCVNGNFAFKHQEIVDAEILSGRYLLHVRSMNGKAVNNLVDL